MKRLARRRLVHVVTTLSIVVLVVLAYWVLSARLASSIFLSGWVLASLVVFLAAYNVRKKLPALPLGSSSTWLHLHVDAGVVAIVVAALHVGYRMPTGILEGTLALVFALTAASGVFGLALSRVLPARLLARGENIMLERIPRVLRTLRETAESIAFEASATPEHAAIADLYRDRFVWFFHAPRHFWSHLVGSQRPRQALLESIATVKRYQRVETQAGLANLERLVEQKDDLDARHAGLTILRWWLFVHIPLTTVLVILMLTHLVLVHAFAGGG